MIFQCKLLAARWAELNGTQNPFIG